MLTASNRAVLPESELAERPFALWAEVYDDHPNPFLSLEERHVTHLLPEIKGRCVLDVGCGTGRWLKLLAPHSPEHLIGIDNSPEMLDRARAKIGSSGDIWLGDCCALPITASSVDIAFVSFLLSYVEELHSFIQQLRRVVRPGGQVFVTDLHPETASHCGWKRGFRSRKGSVELLTHCRTVQEIAHSFEVVGFQAECILEPSFGTLEEAVLRKAGKLDAFEAANGLPAIYIFRLVLPGSDAQTNKAFGDDVPLTLVNASVAIGPRETVSATVCVKSGQIEFIGSHPSIAGINQSDAQPRLDLTGYLLLPGLINSHDHLEFGLFPRLGRGNYQNAQEWATDIQSTNADLIAKLQAIPKSVRLWWGAIRNLLCGVTTVCHHNPLTPELLNEDFPIRVLAEFGWAHSLQLEPNIAYKFKTTPAEAPFVLHAAEGIDAASANEIFELDRLNLLSDQTVLVHGLALNEQGTALLNSHGAALVWCPTSNKFLFGRTHTREFLNSLDNVVLGSDSPLTCSGDLLDDIQFACSEIGLDADELYRMLLSRPARVFRMHRGQGALCPTAYADLIAVSDNSASPAARICEMSAEDIGLVIVRGRVQLASDAFMRRLPAECITGLWPLEVDDRVVWIRAPLDWLFQETLEVLGCEIHLGRKRLRNVWTAWI